MMTMVLFGCGGDDGSSKPSVPATAAEYTERGWGRFTAGDLDGALSDFDSALGLDGNYGPAYRGQGWARLSLAASNTSMQLASASFDSAMSHHQTQADCLGGRAAAYLGMGGATAYMLAATNAGAALLASPDFTFEHRNSFDATDLKLIIAFAYGARGFYVDAISAANEISDSGIQEGDSETWVVGGNRYDSFVGAVLAYLQKLSDEHAG